MLVVLVAIGTQSRFEPDHWVVLLVNITQAYLQRAILWESKDVNIRQVFRQNFYELRKCTNIRYAMDLPAFELAGHTVLPQNGGDVTNTEICNLLQAYMTEWSTQAHCMH